MYPFPAVDHSSIQDIKPNNLLYTMSGILKIADFGLARSFADPHTNMSHQVVTRWYRPPELFYGAKHYGSAVDVFSMGAVFAELVLRAPYLPGSTDLAQLDVIVTALGQPSEQNWPGVTKLPQYCATSDAMPPEVDLQVMKRQFPSMSTSGLQLLHGMLRLDPRKRVSAREALESEWFREEPMPTKPHDLPGKKGKEEQEKVGQDLKRRAGYDDVLNGEELIVDRGKNVARRLDFGGM